MYNVNVPGPIGNGDTVDIVIPGLTNPVAGSYAWQVDSNAGSAAAVTAMVTIAEPGGVTPTPTAPTPGMVDVSTASVTARPMGPGENTKIAVKFTTNEFLAIDDEITLQVTDDLGVPSSIDASDVSIRGMAAVSASAAASPETAAPLDVIIDSDRIDDADLHVIVLTIGDMDDDEGPEKGLAPGEVTVTFRQAAGITNRTEGGGDDWFVKTSAETTRAQIDNVDPVPLTITLSSEADSRGEVITAVGKGFKNGTTTMFWRDRNADGDIDSNETVLCEAIANGDDIAECTFTLFSPPFKPGKGTGGDMNYINAIDGRDKTATMPLKQIELEPSMSVSPKQGIPGDSINVQLHDFMEGDTVTRIEFARSIDICDDDADTDIPTCRSIGARGAVGNNGALSFSFVIPSNVRPGTQDLRVHTTNAKLQTCLLYTSPSPRDRQKSRMPSSA